MLSCMGLFDPDDDLMCFTLINHAFLIIAECINRGEKCFLARSRWLALVAPRPKAPVFERLSCRILRLAVFVPSIVLLAREAHIGLVDRGYIAKQARELSRELQVIDESILEYLHDLDVVQVTEEACSSGPVRYIYRSKDITFLGLCLSLRNLQRRVQERPPAFHENSGPNSRTQQEQHEVQPANLNATQSNGGIIHLSHCNDGLF
jgi:hypothetical protein